MSIIRANKFQGLDAPNPAIELPVDGTVILASGFSGDLESKGTFTASGLIVENNGTIQGNGTVQGSLTIDGTTTVAVGASGTPAITASGDPNTGLFFPAADTTSFSQGGTERFRFGSAGQFGIGGATYGTSGQFLQSQGGSAAPQWASAGYTSLGTTNFTGSSLTVTGIPTTARHIVIAFSGLSVNSTSTPHLTLQVGNGSLSTTEYYWSIAYGTSNQVLNATSSVRIFHTDFASASNSYVGVIDMYTTDNHVIGNIHATALSQQPSRGTFYWAGGSAIDRVNLSSASTFDAGRFIVLYI